MLYEHHNQKIFMITLIITTHHFYTAKLTWNRLIGKSDSNLIISRGLRQVLDTQSSILVVHAVHLWLGWTYNGETDAPNTGAPRVDDELLWLVWFTSFDAFVNT